MTDKSTCCQCRPAAVEPLDWIQGKIDSPAGPVSVVGTRLTSADRSGARKARWGFNRMDYRVEPGLYAAGAPDMDSPVLVSANYKMSFDHIRSQVEGRDVWILVLDTKGINVWCAAGKGTFGTQELLDRIEAARLPEVVSHRKLIVPQLGATGVSAHEVKAKSGFRVIFGPVRAQDLGAFLDEGNKATSEMRRVRFPLCDRIVLIPIEWRGSIKHLMIILVCFVLLSGLGPDGYSAERLMKSGFISALLLVGGWLCGTALVPVLLPWLPGRMFAAKGAWAGVLFLSVVGYFMLIPAARIMSAPMIAAWILIVPAISSYWGMMFTGSSTYTSLSGVEREMRLALPVQIGCAAMGAILWIVGLFM